ncbi:MAG: hypothetical protein KA248_02335 [Kiritimatiellae bacterium]|nr:hypothetical protein [Kiritimatiellia bacterium]
MHDIRSDIAAYAKMKQELELQHMGKWVLVHEGKLDAIYDSSEEAARQAVNKFGRGPYLIRQIGAQDIVLPASVMYRLVHA